MKTLFLPILLLASQSVFAGLFTKTSPCQQIYFQNYERTLSERRALLDHYRQLTGKDFNENKLEKTNAGILTGALLCPIAAGFAIATGGAGAVAPVLFCGEALALGAARDGMVNDPYQQPAPKLSSEKQKQVEEIKQKLDLNLAEHISNASSERLLFGNSYPVFLAIIENSKKITGQELEPRRLGQAVSQMRKSTSDELCPNQRPLNFSELTAELLKRYNNQ